MGSFDNNQFAAVPIIDVRPPWGQFCMLVIVFCSESIVDYEKYILFFPTFTSPFIYLECYKKYRNNICIYISTIYDIYIYIYLSFYHCSSLIISA